MRPTALLLALFLTSATADNPRAMQLLEQWIVAVDRHGAGERDEALKAIAAWTEDDLLMMRAYVAALTELPVNNPGRATLRRQIARNELLVIRRRTTELRARGSFDEFRKRGAVLHTDAALLESVPKAINPPPPRAQRPQWQRDQPERTVDVMSADGRVDSFTIANPHWPIAMDLLEALPAAPKRDPIVAQWFRAVGAYFASIDDRADALRHFARAREIVPDDPAVLFGEACLQETLGSPAVQNFARLANLPNGMVILGVNAPSSHFRRAEALLKRALAAQPDFVDARLRLGHVLIEQREHEAALPHLAQVIAETSDPLLTYYAHLFAGDAALALDRPAESRASYERALTSHPEAQSARLGLAAALRAGGDRAAAADAAMVTLTIPPGARDEEHDPWWIYYSGDATNVDRLLADLRAPFRSPAR